MVAHVLQPRAAIEYPTSACGPAGFVAAMQYGMEMNGPVPNIIIAASAQARHKSTR